MAVHAAKHPNVSHRSYGILDEGERSQTIPHEGFGNQIKVGILNIQNNRSTAQSQMAWVRTP